MDPTTNTTEPKAEPPHSRRACSDAGNGPYHPPLDGKGCGFCDNQGKYGSGKSTCGKCNRCHGCGSTNNGIGPIQSIYFGGKWVAHKIGEAITGKDAKEGQKS